MVTYLKQYALIQMELSSVWTIQATSKNLSLDHS